MVKLINKDAILDDMQKELEKAVRDESMTEFNCKVLMTSAFALKNFVNRQPIISEAEIKAKVLDKVCKAISNLLSGDTKHLEGSAYYKELAYIEVLRMVEKLKEEEE